MMPAEGGSRPLIALVVLIAAALVIAVGLYWLWGTQWAALRQLNAGDALGYALRYVECEDDCDDEMLLALGVEGGVDALETLAESGPPENRLRSYERALRDTYRALATEEAGRPEPRDLPTEDEYVDLYLSTYRQRYESAALRALGRTLPTPSPTAMGPAPVSVPDN